MINFNVKVKIDSTKLRQKRKQSKKFAQMQLDEDVLKDSNYFIPEESGNLMQSGILHTRIGSGKVIWKTPYARRLYYNPQYHFHKETNPNAQGLWFEAAKKLHKEDWLHKAKKKYSKFFNGK